MMGISLKFVEASSATRINTIMLVHKAGRRRETGLSSNTLRSPSQVADERTDAFNWDAIAG